MPREAVVDKGPGKLQTELTTVLWRQLEDLRSIKGAHSISEVIRDLIRREHERLVGG